MRALGNLRLYSTASENEIHRAIAEKLRAAGIAFKHEARLGKRDRVDFMCAGGIAVEVKRGKPNTYSVDAQIERYCASDEVTALVLVTERGLCRTTDEANGKPVRVVTLSTNWGIAL
jgi:hypothetical protein